MATYHSKQTSLLATDLSRCLVLCAITGLLRSRYLPTLPTLPRSGGCYRAVGRVWLAGAIPCGTAPVEGFPGPRLGQRSCCVLRARLGSSVPPALQLGRTPSPFPQQLARVRAAVHHTD